MVKKIFLFSFFSFMFLNFAFALDEYIHETKFKTDVNFFKIDRDIKLELKQKSKYDFDEDDWMSYEYAVCFGVPLKDFLEYELEYVYVDEKKDKDAEEIENNFIFILPTYKKIDIEDENKFKVNIRKGQWEYKNEIKLCRPLFEKLSLLLENEIGLSLETNEWTKNELKPGFLIELSENCELELKYLYTQNIEKKESSDGMISELTFKF